MYATIAMFKMVLAEYSIEQIQPAFVIYLKANSDMPAPADIVKIIEGKDKPMDHDVYRSLTKKDMMLRTPDEWNYIRHYEAKELKKIKENM